MYDLLTVGYLARDISYQVDKLPEPNAEAFITSFRETHGGASGNVAAYASYTFGHSCAIYSVVGEDGIAEVLVRRLSERDGVDVSHIITATYGQTTTVTLITDKLGQKMFFTYPGCVSTIDTDAFIANIPIESSRLSRQQLRCLQAPVQH